MTWLDQLVGVDDLALEDEGAAADPRQVEEVVDEPCLEEDVAADHLEYGAKRVGGVSGSSSIAVTVARTGVSGVRSSWLRVARKRSLARLAASASARAACSRSIRTRSSAARLRFGDIAEDEDPAQEITPVAEPRDPHIERRRPVGVGALQLEARLPRLRDPAQPLGERRPAAKTRAASFPWISASRRPKQPPRRRVQLDDPARRIDHDDRVVHPLDDRRPRHRRQVEQPVSEQAGQKRQPGHREGHRGGIDVDEAEELRHVDDVDHPGQEHPKEHDGGLGAVDAGGPDHRLKKQDD